MANKNLCGKTRPIYDPYEIWVGGGWTWRVLKKYSTDDDALYARWFCFVTSPYCPEGEYGDTYVAEIKRQARRIFPLTAGERAFINAGHNKET